MENFGQTDEMLVEREAFIRRWYADVDVLGHLDADSDRFDGLGGQGLVMGVASDFEFIIPAQDTHVRGFGNLMQWFMPIYRSMPDTTAKVDDITFGTFDTAIVTLDLSGTQLEPTLPILPMGKFSERFVALLTFNEQGHLSREVMYDCSIQRMSPQVCNSIFESTPLFLLTKVGSGILQDALQVSHDLGVVKLLEHLRGKVLETSRSLYGSHVLRICISTFPPVAVQLIAAEFTGHAHVAALHACSCRVLQCMLEHGSNAQMKALVEELLQDVCDLMMHRFGNFVMQRLLERGDAATRCHVIDVICSSNVPYLSRHEFASHVLRVAFESGSPEDRIRMARAIAPNRSELASLSKHRSGNFLARQAKLAFRLAPCS